jgi:hypothetical protein
MLTQAEVRQDLEDLIRNLDRARNNCLPRVQTDIDYVRAHAAELRHLFALDARNRGLSGIDAVREGIDRLLRQHTGNALQALTIASEMAARLRVRITIEEGAQSASTMPTARPGTPEPLRARARWISDTCVRMLPPANRARYREEYQSELADLSRRDQMAHAVRLAARTWPLRRALKRPSGRAVTARALIVSVAPAAGMAALAALNLPTAAAGTVLIVAVLAVVVWTVGSDDRTGRLASLISAVRGQPRQDSSPPARRRYHR